MSHSALPEWCRGVHDPDGKLGPEPAPARPPTDPSASWTLGQFYAGYARDVLGVARESRTDNEYCQSLKYWQRFTGDPPISEITLRTFAMFLNQLKHLPGAGRKGSLSESTRRKHCSNIQRLLDRTGPPTQRLRGAANLVPQAPWIKPPAKSKMSRVAHSLEDMHALLEACWSMPSTPMIPQIAPSVWWRALILFLYNTGQRIGAAMGARIEALDGRWLVLPPTIVKGGSGLTIWLNDPALEAVESIGSQAGPLFPWRDWPKSSNTLHKHRRWLERKAKVKQLGFYGFRRAFARYCGAINPLAAQVMMNHKGLGTRMMIDHYIGNAEPILSAALTQLGQKEYQPRPAEPPAKPKDPQLILFDKQLPEIP